LEFRRPVRNFNFIIHTLKDSINTIIVAVTPATQSGEDAVLTSQSQRGVLRPCNRNAGRHGPDRHCAGNESLRFDGTHAARHGGLLSRRSELARSITRKDLRIRAQLNDYPDAESLARVTDRFYLEATRLKAKYRSEITLLIGFESEWIRPSSLDLIHGIREKYQWDLFVGSVHHVHTIPIDFNRQMYEDAREKSGGSSDCLRTISTRSMRC
jgi:hypothetical protein